VAEGVVLWWLWTGTGEHPHLGWSHVDFEIHALAGKGETRLRGTGGVVSRLTDEFAYRDSDGKYHADVKRNDSDNEGVRSSLQQTTNATADQVSIGVHLRDTPTAPAKSSPPANFVPGALLPQLMGKIRVTSPMILRTESFPGGYEAAGPPELLTVLIQPTADNATTRKADGETEPMRCVTAEVNGSGRVSRWFFRKSGELEYVEFPGGVQRVPSDQAAIGFDFGHDKRMAP
jgi:hypothetical protein